MKIVQEQATKLIEAYRAGLKAAVAANPEAYIGFTEDTVIRGNVGRTTIPRQTVDEYVDNRISPLIRKNGVLEINVRGSDGWKRTCKLLGIPFTVRALTAFLAGEVTP